MISSTLSTFTPLANGYTIREPRLSYKQYRAGRRPPPIHFTLNRKCIKNMCLSLVAKSEKMRKQGHRGAAVKPVKYWLCNKITRKICKTRTIKMEILRKKKRYKITKAAMIFYAILQ